LLTITRINIAMNSPPKLDSGKKPYRAPSLQHYGDLARITRTVSQRGEDDGGKGIMKGTAL
jgi:hypothetical protein